MTGVPMYWNLVLDWVTFICVDKKSQVTTSKVPMNWNWVLDWVISYGSWTKLSSGFMNVYLCIGIGYWIGFHSYKYIGKITGHNYKVPMNWNWVLDWVTFVYIEKNHRTSKAR